MSFIHGLFEGLEKPSETFHLKWAKSLNRSSDAKKSFAKIKNITKIANERILYWKLFGSAKLEKRVWIGIGLTKRSQTIHEERRDKSRTLIFNQSQFLAQNTKATKIRWLTEKELSLDKVKELPAAYLGKDTTYDMAYWAVDLHQHTNLIDLASLDAKFLDPRPASFELSDFESAVFAQARSVVDWGTRRRYCPSCAALTVLDESGYKKTCSNSACTSVNSSISFFSDHKLKITRMFVQTVW